MQENDSLLKKILAYFSKQNVPEEEQNNLNEVQDNLDDLLAMSTHWDGYQREKAVRCLGAMENPKAIPQLIVRVNDWVPQVRNAAKESLEKLLKPENAEAFLLNLPDLYHLQNCGRGNHNQLITKVTHFLLEPSNVACITAAIKNDNPYIARIAVKLCIENSLITKQNLVSETLSHADVVIRNIAANFLRDFSGQVLELFLQRAIKDPFMPIRREAFQLYLRVIPEKGLEIAHKFLFDKHLSIREIAIMQLLKHGVDVQMILSNILSSENQKPSRLKAAILGLAHIGSKQSIPMITKFINNPLPSIRKARLQALVKLVGEETQSYLITGLQDRSPSVSKESLSLLNKLQIRLSVDNLLSIFEHNHYQHTFIVCISIAKKINKWDRLIFLLHLYPLFILSDSEKLKIVDNELLQWNNCFNCSASQPSQTQMKQIIAKYNRCKDLLNEKRRKSLEFTIEGFKISPNTE